MGTIRTMPLYLTSSGKQVEAKVGVGDQRIIFELNGKFDKHITNILPKSNCMVRWILRTFRTRTKEIMFTLFKTSAVPQVEYGCIIWMPISQPH